MYNNKILCKQGLEFLGQSSKGKVLGHFIFSIG
jgi:hypothetical protein